MFDALQFTTYNYQLLIINYKFNNEAFRIRNRKY